nr:MAG TPA: hypothetical protein [Caudoviricetes sp.]
MEKEYNENYELFLEETTKEILRSGLPINGGWVKITEKDARNIVEHIGKQFLFFTDRIELVLRTPIKKFLFIEGGSIKQEDITSIEERNPEIKVLVYRQGSVAPCLKGEE